MPLKRGLERESCDFCFRRKVKCDRSSRIATGYPACSQCDLRETFCTFKSDDVRIQRRRQGSGALNTSFGPDSASETPVAVRKSSRAIFSNVEQTYDPSRSMLALDGYTSAPALSSASVSNPSSLGGTEVTTSIPSLAPDHSQSAFFPNVEFDLSPESISYLGSIFFGSDWTPLLSTVDDNSMVDAAAVPPLIDELDGSELAAIPKENPYHVSGIGTDTMNAAIEAYFTFASLALPILYKDAFMDDYKSHRSSPALVFAVACRGCPFIQAQAQEKWTIQQCLASRFRDAFLLSRSSAEANHDAAVRLDDLEALALMVDFEYDKTDSQTSPIQSQLQNLFLTRDSLVMMTLQYRTETRPVAAGAGAAAPVTLSKATQRQTLLFWYIYGWDAFTSLDHKLGSRIRDDDDGDDDADPSRRLGDHESHVNNYFDAILNLAAIARRMARELCGSVARRKGVSPKHVESLYKQLEEWQMNISPVSQIDTWESRDRGANSLQRRTSTTRDAESTGFSPLHQVFLTFLKLNLYLQLEACVSEYGLKDRSSFLGQIVEGRVRYETLQAAYKVVKVAQWANDLSERQLGFDPGKGHNVFDLAPELLRNICVGAARWLSRRAKEMIQATVLREASKFEIRTPECIASDENTVDSSREQARSLMESGIMLRDIAATATSHRDTGHLIGRLDEELESLKKLMRKQEI